MYACGGAKWDKYSIVYGLYINLLFEYIMGGMKNFRLSKYMIIFYNQMNKNLLYGEGKGKDLKKTETT